MDLCDAYESFKDWVWATTHERCRDRRSDFKAAIKAMLPQIEFLTRTTRPHPGRLFIKGLGFKTLTSQKPETWSTLILSGKSAPKRPMLRKNAKPLRQHLSG
jgi:hypothetical protein